MAATSRIQIISLPMEVEIPAINEPRTKRTKTRVMVTINQKEKDSLERQKKVQ